MNALRIKIRTVIIVVLVTTLCGSVGCAKMSWKPSKMFSLDSTWPFRDKDEPREGVPARMACTWTDTIMSQPGKASQRGFGGRLLFYENNEKNPILVDGQLVVYAFDENGREPTDNKPTRRYVFPPEQVPLHMSKSELGASYSFFLPWDEAGGPRTEVSLICRFEPKGGAVISGEQTRLVLPGRIVLDGKQEPLKVPEGVASSPAAPTLQGVQAKRNDERNAQLASYETPVAAAPRAPVVQASQSSDELPARRMTATTINLPGSYQLPTAAALMNPVPAPAQPATPSTPALMPVGPQPAAALTPQAAVPAYQAMPVMQQGVMIQPPTVNQPFPGAQPMANASALTAQPTMQTPMNARSGGLPGTATILPTTAGMNTIPAVQPPLTQQQAQLAAQQLAMQQALQQQVTQQQQALQQRMMPAQVPLQTAAPQVAAPQVAAPQLPFPANGTATVSYPTATLYRR